MPFPTSQIRQLLRCATRPHLDLGLAEHAGEVYKRVYAKLTAAYKWRSRVAAKGSALAVNVADQSEHMLLDELGTNFGNTVIVIITTSAGAVKVLELNP